MNSIRLKITARAIVGAAIAAPAGHAESPAIRNCTGVMEHRRRDIRQPRHWRGKEKNISSSSS
jgi:hypothetical protein